MPWLPAISRRDARDAVGVAGDERDMVAARRERFDEGEAEARRAAGDGDAKRCSRGRVSASSWVPI